MSLTLTITNTRRETADLQRTKVFETRGGTIGRTQGNDWVLPDPERFVSGSHAKIQYRDGTYFLGDTSTNGVFVNGSSQPVGMGNFLALHDGDRLLIGDYEISVTVDGDDRLGSVPAPSQVPHDDLIDPPAALGGTTPPEFGPASDPQTIAEDPFAFLDEAPLASSPPPWESASTGRAQDSPPPAPFEAPSFDQGSPLDDFFTPPTPGGGTIPEDWDSTDLGAPEPPVQQGTPSSFGPGADMGAAAPEPPLSDMLPAAAPSGYQEPVVPNPGPKLDAGAPTSPPPSLPNRPTVGAGSEVGGELGFFLKGAGLLDVNIAPEAVPALMTALGGMFRELVQGVMEVLMARSKLKSEFRMTMTTVRPVENNPLKFSVDVDEALRSLLTKQGPGYLSPAEAVHEGVMDIKGHQVAMMAGMQAAFRELLRRFDPKAVEGMAGKGGKLGTMMPSGRKAKCWELYEQQYQDIIREAEDHFQRLFGEEFARAYEEQIEHLRGTRGQE